MKLPLTINLFGKKIAIKRSDLRSELALGKTDGDTIWLCLHCPKRDLKRVFLHELGHCLFFRLGLHNCNIPVQLEEVIVDGFATMLDELITWRFKS